MESFKKIKHTAVFDGQIFKHFGIHPITAAMYGHKATEIIEVELFVAEDQTIPEFDNTDMKPDYWGWQNKEGKFSLIYQKYFLLNMCFPNGIKAAEDAGQGKAFRIHVNKLEN